MRRLTRPARFRMTFLVSLVFFATASTGLCSTIFSNTSSISIPATTGGASLPATSDPYPSQIVVSDMVGTLTEISVTINDWTDNGVSASPGDLFFMLVAPGGQGFDFLGGVGSTHPFSNVNLAFEDSATNQLNSGQIISGTFKPTVLGSCPAFPAPAPSGIQCAPPQGTTTFFTAFQGSDPNGTWSLYIVDDSAGDTASTISGGWSIAIGSTGGHVVPAAPEPSSLSLIGLAIGLFALLRRQKRQPASSGSVS